MIMPSVSVSLTVPVFPFGNLTFYADNFALLGAYCVHDGCAAGSQFKTFYILAAKDQASLLPTS